MQDVYKRQMRQIDLKEYPQRFMLSGLPVVNVGINFDVERHNITDWEVRDAGKMCIRDSFLNVHEGPQNFRLNENPTVLVPGMITSDEPGLYKTGELSLIHIYRGAAADVENPHPSGGKVAACRH